MSVNSCYKFEKTEYKDGLLSNCVDATYIIHLEGNGRLKSIQNQLKEYHPTNILYIVYNKGYKKCEKPKYVKNTARDLVDANLQIFKHAEQQGYGNILILEDDFMFSEKIKETRHIDNICNHLKNNAHSTTPYALGCIPFLIFPIDLNNYAGIIGGTHCVIFNKPTRSRILSIGQENIKDWDIHSCLNYPFIKRHYYLPICYQLWPETENAKNWGIEYGKWFSYFYFKTLLFIFKMLKLDKQPEPGFTILCAFGKLFSLLVGFLILFFLYKIGKFVINMFPKISKYTLKWQKKFT